MSAPKLNVLISGAGIAGSCLAYWLARTKLDVSVTVVERSARPRVTGQAVDIRGAAIDVLKKMGLEERLRALHTTEERTELLGAGGKVLARFEGGDSFTAEYEILRGDLSRMFVEATEGLGCVKYVYGDHIEAMEQTDDEVHVTFAGGSKATYDLVVAADGTSSRTRPMILDEEMRKDCYRFLGQYTAFYSIPSVPEDTKVWKWYNEPKGLAMMLRPHRNPETMGTYLCITTPAHEQRHPDVEAALDGGVDAQKAILREYFKESGWEAERLLSGMDASDDFYMSRISLVRLPKWTSNRAALLGDAAWATFGVGTTLAVQGAYFLAGELSKIQSSKDVPGALEAWEAAFRPHASRMESVPSIFPQVGCPQTAWGLWLRNSLAWAASAVSLHKLVSVDRAAEFELPEYDWRDVPAQT